MTSRIYGLDSFEGFPEPTANDAFDDGTMDPAVHKGGLGDTSYDELSTRLRQMGLSDQVTLIKGFFDDTLHQLATERFSLVHLDCDLYESYMSCLEFAYERMLPGAFMVFDDYNSPAYVGAKRAVDEFFAMKPERLQFFPEALGRRYFTRMGGDVAPGAVVAPAETQGSEARKVA